MRTRVTSASCKLPIRREDLRIRFSWVAGEASDKEADIIYPAWFVEDLIRNCCYALLEAVGMWLCECCRARRHPSRQERGVIRRGLDLP